jgi:tripartite-type tricarboxylate transporter receptor subunit TctC
VKLRTIAALALAAACSFSGPAGAQSFPSKPIRLVVGYAAGGITDAVARILAMRLSETLRQQVVIENKPGAGGGIAFMDVARASPDGYTLLLLSDQTAAEAPSFKLDMKDIAPVAFIGAVHYALVVSAGSDLKSLADFVQSGRSKPIDVGHGGDARSRTVVAQIKRATRVDISEIPYKGGGPAVVDVIGGRIRAAILPLPSVQRLAQEGKVRVLAIFGSHRLPGFENLPMAAEQNLRVVVFNGHGLAAPAGTPNNVIEILEAAVSKTLREPEVKSKLAQIGLDPFFSGSTQYSAYLKAGSVAGLGGGSPIANCDGCTSDVCTAPSDTCRICCQKP